jgi:GTPase-associated protein 1, N-terminal domain type 1
VTAMPRIDNCLFGYQDGHRLLASSMKIAGESASQLTLLSDLAPGARFGSSDGYWTGLPLPLLDRYALMRTWPAPEMSRPGCVWTHAILVETSLFEDVDDLSRLRELARRPMRPNDLSFYQQPSMMPSSSSHGHSSVQAFRAIEILENLYGFEESAISVEEPGKLDDDIFAIWSQQWPRLRRNFKFQTAVSDETGTLRSPFDLRLQWRHSPNSKLPPLLTSQIPAWLEAAAADLSVMSDHEMRRFLWRFGKDVKKQRGSFRPLCEIFVSTLSATVIPTDSDLVRSISGWFPAKDDAFALKRAVVDGEVLPQYQLDVLSFILKQDKGESFPFPSSKGIERLIQFWPEKATKILELAEFAISEDNELALAITGIVLNLVPAPNFWAATKGFPKVRRKMIQSRPDLLDADEILELNSALLANLIEDVPADDPIGAALVRRLLHHANQEIADKILRRFPTFAVREFISEAYKSDTWRIRDWFRVLAEEPSLALNPSSMAGVKHTSTLYRLGEELGWLSPDVLRAGTAPWVAGLTDCENDLPRDESDVLNCFLLALAIEVGDRGAQTLFEKCFDQIHNRILQSYLSWKANDILLPCLPQLNGRRNWDTGLRLRLCITNTYIQNRLDPKSFAILLRDEKGRELLKETAKELEGGEPYARSIFRL